jgi:hypothetical protein
MPVIPLLGARKVTQLQDNLASFQFDLLPDHLKVLDESSRIDVGFPYDLFTKPPIQSLLYGGMRDRLLIPADF